MEMTINEWKKNTKIMEDEQWKLKYKTAKSMSEFKKEIEKLRNELNNKKMSKNSKYKHNKNCNNKNKPSMPSTNNKFYELKKHTGNENIF